MAINMQSSFMNREDVIDEIIAYKMESLYLDDAENRDQIIEGIFRYGITGLEDLCNAELAKMFHQIFEEKVIISDE